MAPRRLSTTLLSPRHFVFANDAISSSASPLQVSFNLSCRSPVRLTHDVPLPRSPLKATLAATTEQPSIGSLYLESPSRYAEIRSPSRTRLLSPRTPKSLANTRRRSHDIVDDNDEETPTDRSWFLPQPSPGSPPSLTPMVRQQRDEGKLGVISAVNIIVGKTIGVGAYSVPSAVFEGVGSVGMALLIWILGSIISFCGLAVYLDLGTAIPKSGGERVYLERIFRRPRMLATCMYMTYVVLLGFSTPNAIVLGEYAMYAVDMPVNRWNVRAIAVISVSLLCYIHARHPRLGLRLINVLGVTKVLILVFIVLSGVAAGLAGVGNHHCDGTHSHVTGHHIDADLVGVKPLASAMSGATTAQRNFQDMWAGSSVQPYDYATALLKVIYCFRGYSTANQVLSDVKNPAQTLRVAAPLALILVSVCYLAVNVAFFLVVDKDEFRSAGVVAAGVFFRNVFGEGVGAPVLPLCVIISAAGNIAATSFAQARVNEELAKDGLLPLAQFWTSHKEPGAEAASGSPTRGLLLHWIVSVAVIVLPPPGKMYTFLVDIGSYPVSVISVAVAGGLLYLHSTPSEQWASPWPAPRWATVVFAASNCFLLILPWMPPADGRGENERFAYYAYPMTALAVLGSGAVYWCWWWIRGGHEDAQANGGADKDCLSPDGRSARH